MCLDYLEERSDFFLWRRLAIQGVLSFQQPFDQIIDQGAVGELASQRGAWLGGAARGKKWLIPVGCSTPTS